jgi:hypothetical protein
VDPEVLLVAVAITVSVSAGEVEGKFLSLDIDGRIILT